MVFQDYVQRFSYISQNNEVLPFPFEKNMTLGKKGSKYSLEELISLFHLESIFDSKREELKKEQQNFSGEEKQRICVAIALYRNKKWLFLDEAFYAMDKETSQEIHNLILSDPDITVVTIEHQITRKILLLYDEVLLVNHKKIKQCSVSEYVNQHKQLQSGFGNV